MFAQRQNSRDHWAGRVNNVAGMRVVVVQDVRADTVDQRGVQNIKTFFPAENTSLRGTRKSGHCSNGDVYRFMA
jgi:hypothetical protein